MFQGSFKGVAGKFHGSFKRISRSFQGCFKGASKLFQGCVKCVSIKFHRSFKELLMVSVSRNILRVFQCSFKGISKKLRKFPVSFQDVFKGSLKHIDSLS